MARGSSKPEAVAVLDVGKTNVKLLAIAPDGKILSSRSAPNAVRWGEPYPHCDTEHIWRWMMAALADLGERFAIAAIVPTGYGSTAALVAGDALVLPIMDYEAEPPADDRRGLCRGRALVRGMLLPDQSGRPHARPPAVLAEPRVPRGIRAAPAGSCRSRNTGRGGCAACRPAR